MVKKKPLISIIVPVFNEADNVRPLYQRLSAVFEGLKQRYEFEIVFTDNHSDDGTFDALAELAGKDKRIRVFRFSRNFGFQRSILTGYLKARGDAAIQIDCDLQDPPELVAGFLEKYEQGHDVVYGIRQTRREGPLINLMRKAFYWLIDSLSEDQLPHQAGDFRLVSRRVINVMDQVDDSNPYLRGMIAGFGFKQTGIPYDRSGRERGKSKFTFLKLMSLALDGILGHSLIPLRIASLTALVMAGITFLGLLFYFFGNIFFGQEWPAGFATTTVLLLLSITLNALFLGIIGEYLGRIYQQVKKQPMTIIEKTINSPDEDTAP